MKKTIILLLLACFAYAYAHAQGQAIEAVVELNKKYFSLSDSVGMINKQYRLSTRNTHEKNTESIRQTAHSVEAMNKSLKALEASLSATEYFTSIAALNNPTNDELGFRLETEILKVIDDKILKKGGGKIRRIDKFRKIVANIVNNPITNLLTSFVPAVSSITSVVNLVNSQALDNDNIEAEDLKNFHQEIRKFTEHYENLAQANTNLINGINTLNIKVDALDRLLFEFTKTSAVDLYKKDIQKNNINELIREYYNYAKVDAQIKAVERNNSVYGKINYEKIITEERLSYSVVGRQKLAFMGDELDKFVTEYQNMLDVYHKDITKILEKATQISTDKDKIKLKIDNLNRQYNNLRNTCEQSIDLKTTKSRLLEVPMY